MKKSAVPRSATQLLGTIALGGTLAASLMACSPQGLSNSSFASSMERDEKSYDFSSGMSGGTKGREETAEAMALLAESLVRPNTAHQAYRVAFQALEHNQYNVRAQFVLKSLQPLMTMRGIYTRIQPVVSVRPDKLSELKNHIREIQTSVSAPDAVDFLVAGQPDLHTEGQIQDVIEKYVEKTDEFRDWLKENRKVAHTVNYYRETAPSVPACRAIETAPKVWSIQNCSKNVEKITAKMNIADFEALRQNFSGVQTYIAMSTAYSVDGLFKAAAKLPAEGTTAAEKVPAYTALEGIGQLRNNKFFVMLPKMTADLVVGLKIAKKMHKQLCPAGTDRGGSRKGMLYRSGICVEKSATMDRLVSTLDLMAQGKLAKVSLQVADQSLESTVDVKTFTANVPKNLRDLGTVSFDKCGEISGIGDGTLNGLFVNGELNTALNKGSKANCL